MKVNKVAPWEGELAWVADPRTGTTKNGKQWASVDFVLKYVDEQGNDRHIMFNVFGNDKVNIICSATLGTRIRIDWKPEAREYNGKWFGKLDAYGITVMEQPKEDAKPTEMPKEEPLFDKSDEVSKDDGQDLPF